MPDPVALARRLREIQPATYHVVTLPDFFLDHFVRVPPWDKATALWKAVHGQGGGNVPTPHQHFQAGGNAANTALALARLGVATHLVARTSEFGRAVLETSLGRAGVDLTHVRADGELSVTTALEFQEDRPANVMLSDPGSLAQYGPENLTPNEWTLLDAADLVLVANWSQNQRGTALLEAVARACHRAGTAVMLDTGDPSHRARDLAELRERILPMRELDIYALNENELRQLVAKSLAAGDEERAAAQGLAAQRPSGTLDLHTSRFAATHGPKGHATVPTFAVAPLRVTGAGDSWNAGNILGHLSGLAPAERLMLANAVAALYITSPNATAPTLADVVQWLENAPALNGP